MSIYVVGEVPTVEAFELIGIPGRRLGAHEDVGAVVNQLARSGAQLVLVQSDLASRLTEDRLDQLRRGFGCLVLEVPGINRPQPEAQAFRQSLQRSLGVLA